MYFYICRAIAVKVAAKRLPVSPISGFDLYHHFRNDAFNDLYNLLKVRKTGKREVVLLQPLPQWLWGGEVRVLGDAMIFSAAPKQYVQGYLAHKETPPF